MCHTSMEGADVTYFVGSRKGIRAIRNRNALFYVLNGASDLAIGGQRVYVIPMKRIMEIDDHAFLPWRFYGQSLSIAAGH